MTQDQYGRTTDQNGHWYDGFGNKYDQQGDRYNAWSGVRNDWPSTPPPTLQNSQRRRNTSTGSGTSYGCAATFWTGLWFFYMFVCFISAAWVGFGLGLLVLFVPLLLSFFVKLWMTLRHFNILSFVILSFLLVLVLSVAYPHLRSVTGIGKEGSPGISFRSTCGSPPNGGSVWYSVVGGSKSLDLVKANYCGDAFINSNKKLQVASFTSRSEAEKFANTLSNGTGYKFWVPNR